MDFVFGVINKAVNGFSPSGSRTYMYPFSRHNFPRERERERERDREREIERERERGGRGRDIYI